MKKRVLNRVMTERIKKIVSDHIYKIPRTRYKTGKYISIGWACDHVEYSKHKQFFYEVSKSFDSVAVGEKIGLLAFKNGTDSDVCIVLTDCGFAFLTDHGDRCFVYYDETDIFKCNDWGFNIKLLDKNEYGSFSPLFSVFHMYELESMVVEILYLIKSLDEKADSAENKSESLQKVQDKPAVFAVPGFSAGLPILHNPVIKAKYEIRKAYFLNILDFMDNAIHLCKNIQAAKNNFEYYRFVLGIKDNYMETGRNSFEIGKYRFYVPYDCAAVVGFDKDVLSNTYLRYMLSSNLLIQESKISSIFAMLSGEKAIDCNDCGFAVSEYGVMALKCAGFTRKKPFRILVTATMSAGKSTFINALAGREVCKSQNMACTSRIHHIYSKSVDDGMIGKYDNEYSFHTYDVYNPDENSSDNEEYLAVYFNGLLGGKRVEFIDTPGGNSSENPEHREITRKFIMSKKYQLLLFVINYTNQLPDDEVEHIRFIRENVDEDKIVFILNKIDGYDEKDHLSIPEMAASIQNFLKNECGFSDPIIYPVSARYSLCAKKILSGDTAFMNTRTNRKYYENYVDFFEKNDLNGYYENISCPCNETDDVNGKKSDEIIEAENLLKNCGMTYIEAALLSQIK